MLSYYLTSIEIPIIKIKWSYDPERESLYWDGAQIEINNMATVKASYYKVT